MGNYSEFSAVIEWESETHLEHQWKGKNHPQVSKWSAINLQSLKMWWSAAAVDWMWSPMQPLLLLCPSIRQEIYTQSTSVSASSSIHHIAFLQYTCTVVVDWDGYTAWPSLMYKVILKCKHQSEVTVLEGLGKETRTSERGNIKYNRPKPDCWLIWALFS